MFRNCETGWSEKRKGCHKYFFLEWRLPSLQSLQDVLRCKHTIPHYGPYGQGFEDAE
jgi:hypothetical protein